MIMANLKAVEPSLSFDHQLMKRLNEIDAHRYRETVFEKLARSTLTVFDNLREALLPSIPVFVKTLATFVTVISVGLYAYSIQPGSPVITSSAGSVMIMGEKDNSWQKMTPGYRLKVGDTIATRDNSYIDIERFDKYAVRVKGGSKVMIASLSPRMGHGKVVLDLIEGKVLLNISDGFKGSKFVVNTKAASAVALGTKFEVDQSNKGKPTTRVSVLEGKVQVKSAYTPEKEPLLKRMVMVLAGQKTEVAMGYIPATPQRLIESEWESLGELYQIGRKPQVVLMLKNTSDRAKQLLRPCPIYITDEKPREIPTLIENAIIKTAEAIKSGDVKKHLESIKLLERIVNEQPNPKYDPQLLLYIGAYYEYLSDHKEAIKSFEMVLAKYPRSSFASIAECAIGIVYEEKLNDPAKSEAVYRQVIKNYPNSLEAIWAERKLGIKK